MAGKRKGVSSLPTMPELGIGSPGQDQNQARLFSSALLDAAMNGCTCAPCQLLRQLAQGLKAQLLKETGHGQD